MSDVGIDVEVRTDPAHHYVFGTITTGTLLLGFSVILYGYAITESTGSASAAVDLYDATDHAGTRVLPVRVASGESAESWYGAQGIWFKNGVYANVTSGSITGAVFYRHHRPG